MGDKRTGKKKKQIKPEVKEEVLPSTSATSTAPKKVRKSQKN